MRMAIAPALVAACLLTGCGGQDGGASGSGSQTESGAGAAEDGDQLAKILEAGKIIIGTEGTYSPNSYHDENGDLVGFDVEVGRKVAEKLGVEVEFFEAEWDSLFSSMDAGRIDTVINEVEYSDERALKYDFSNPYTYIRGALMVKGDNEEIKSFEDLDGKKAAQNLTSSWGRMAEEYGAELVGVDAVAQTVDLLLTGRADATLNVETAFSDYLKKNPDADVKVVAWTEEVSSSLIPVKKGNEDLLKAINEAIDELRESGELAELSEKYFGMDVTSED
nr:amino acid ABC transporter substrate-binding protein [uncultured Acetatifactor sp.]